MCVSIHVHRTLAGALLACLIVGVVAWPSQANLKYSWSFDSAGPSGPVQGTIAFNSVAAGVGGTHLTPDSIVITSAPGHTFSDGYALGAEVIGSTTLAGQASQPASQPWSIDTADQITYGVAQFHSSYNIPNDFFVLGTVLGNSQLQTGRQTANETVTVGTATFTLIAATIALPGDANNDGVVSADDFAAVQTHFGDTGDADGWLPGDANDDGVVSADDFASIQTHFGDVQSTAAQTNPIPEPATIALLAIGGAALLKRRVPRPAAPTSPHP